MRTARLARFAWGVLAYNVAVILWGAWVRVTGSGAGCGSHWPTCNGEVIPRSPTAQTLVELSHRLTSGLDLVLVVALFVWTFRAHARGTPARRAAALSLLFLIIEALIGAGLVLFGLVVDDASTARAWVFSAHLVNTMLLLAALTLTAHHTSGGRALSASAAPGTTGPLLVVLAAFLAVAVTGGIAALGDTLFPARSLAEGLAQDLDPSAHVLLRLRMLHPLAAMLGGAAAILVSLKARSVRDAPGVRRAAAAVCAGVALQLLAGLINVVLLAPGYMQILHLLLADAVWIALVVLAARTLERPEGSGEALRPVPEEALTRASA